MAVFDSEQTERLVRAIRDAERGSRGEVRVHVEEKSWSDADARAAQLWVELGMDDTEDETGVLLYVSVAGRTARVLAGATLYEAIEPEFWQRVIDTVAEGFKAGNALGGLEEALQQIGDALRSAVAGDDVAGNELVDEVHQEE